MSDLWILESADLQTLIEALSRAGYAVRGPRLEQDAIVFGPLRQADELPAGWIDEQDAGRYRLRKAKGLHARALFGHVLGPQSLKAHLAPPRQEMWSAQLTPDGFRIDIGQERQEKTAFIGVRACDLAAVAVLDKVFDNGQFRDCAFQQRRENVFLVAVNCGRAGGTCFCVSTNTGPAVRSGFDIALTELLDEQRHCFVLQFGSERGEKLKAELPLTPADAEMAERARRQTALTAENMERSLRPDAAGLLACNTESPRWQAIAERCLNCANCTQVCPTCFCSKMEDSTSLDGNKASRVRVWDSCFVSEHSYIHGGPVRQSTAANYRQWITHKLSTWEDQFGLCGCTGCGRCITWCPVGIDITEELAALQADEDPPS